MIDKSTNRDLTKGLKDHLDETTKQIGRLDQVFKVLGQRPPAVRRPAIDGLIGEAEEVAGEVDDKSQNCGHSLDEPMLKKLKAGEEWKNLGGEKAMTRPAAAEGPQAAPAAQDIADQTAPSEIADEKE